MNVNICIGIISYLPDKESTRKVRIKRLNNLLSILNTTFKLPIIIIAQNWKDADIKLDNVTLIKHYDKLGITLARETLRKVFCNETNYSHIICLDDDFELSNDPKLALIYKYVIKSYPDKFIEYENFLMNLASFPRDIFEQNEFDIDIDPEKGTGFEDWIYMSKLKNKYSDRYRKVKDYGLSIKKRSELVDDIYSSWITEKTNKKKIGLASRNIIYGNINKNNKNTKVIKTSHRSKSY